MQFEDVLHFKDGYAAVKLDGKWGYYSAFLKRVVIPPQFEEAGFFNQGLATVKLNGKWGYIGTNGKFKVQPRFDLAWTYSQRGPVKLDGKWAYVRDDDRLIFSE